MDIDIWWFITCMVTLIVGAGIGYYQGYRDGEGGSDD